MPAYTVDEIRQIVAARQEKGGEGEFAAYNVLLRKLDEATKSSLYENFTVQPLNAEYPQDAAIDYQFRQVTGQSSNSFDTDMDVKAFPEISPVANSVFEMSCVLHTFPTAITSKAACSTRTQNSD